MLKTGDQAPAFQALDHSNQTVRLKDFLGRTLVLWFFPKADTPGCTAEGCSFRDLGREFASKNAAIVGVSFDDVASNAAFHRKYHFTFPLLCDTDRALGRAYGAADDAKATTARRIGVVIDPRGKVAAYHPKVDPKTFASEVLKSL